MGHFATGVTVVCSLDAADRAVGTTANAVTSLSLEPPLVLVCFAESSLTLGAIRGHGGFSVNVLGAHHRELSVAFARRGAVDAWRGVEHDTGATGCPRIRDALASLDCVVERRFSGGDHEIVVGRVIEARTGPPEHDPLVYFRGAYASLAAA
jgi:3-hydroxy-9,10-secoandrosta-1,3,5(10)-triene-9,17-dione monooxygenase reductase component